MLRTFLWGVGAPALALAALLVGSGESQAQHFRGGHYGGHYGVRVGGAHYYGGHWGGYRYGGYPHSSARTWGYPHYYGHSYGRSWGYPRYYGYSWRSPWYLGWPSAVLNYAPYSYYNAYPYTSSYFSAYSYPGYDYAPYAGSDYTPYTNYPTTPSTLDAYTYADTTPSGQYSSFYTPPEPPADVSPAPAAADTSVHLRITVPPDAQLWFNGQPTTQTGSVREFVSPPLTPGRTYHYQVSARWLQDGRAVDRSRTIDVHAGDRVALNMEAPVSGAAQVAPPPPAEEEPLQPLPPAGERSSTPVP